MNIHEETPIDFFKLIISSAESHIEALPSVSATKPMCVEILLDSDAGYVLNVRFSSYMSRGLTVYESISQQLINVAGP